MANWPGKEADDWWDTLPVHRKEQLHRWVARRSAPPPPRPEEMLPLGEDQTLDRTST